MVIFRESTSQNRSITQQEQSAVNLWKSRQQIRHLGRTQLILGHKDFSQSFPTDPAQGFFDCRFVPPPVADAGRSAGVRMGPAIFGAVRDASPIAVFVGSAPLASLKNPSSSRATC